jgi:hypothetical protein
MICPTAKAEYFSREVWTGQISLMRHANFLSRRSGFAGRNIMRANGRRRALIRPPINLRLTYIVQFQFAA